MAEHSAAGTSMAVKILHVVLFGLMFAFWVVFLAGVGAMQHECADGKGGSLSGGGNFITDVPADGDNNGAPTGGNSFLYKACVDGVNRQLPTNSQEKTDALQLCTDLYGTPTGRRMLLSEMVARRVLKSAVEECGNQLSLHWWIVFFQLICMLLAAALAIAPKMLDRFSHTIALLFGMQTTLLIYIASTVVIPAFNAGDADKDSANAVRAASAGSVALCILNLVYLILSTDKEAALAPSFTMPARAATNTATAHGASPEKHDVVVTMGNPIPPVYQTATPEYHQGPVDYNNQPVYSPSGNAPTAP